MKTFKNADSVVRESSNYLERIPVKNSGMAWSTGENKAVTLEVENTGIFNRAAQKLFHKPKFTHIHLDDLGSFIWPLIDGQKDMIALGREVDAHFGGKAAPLYERLAKYFQILESYHFISWKK